MKTLSTIITLLLLVSMIKAQDSGLPKGSSYIYSSSGEVVSNVSLWKINSEKVEYIINGNLADLETTNVSKIETPKFLIKFDDENQIVKSDYDIIILAAGDTIRGFIDRIGDKRISYTSIGNNKKKSVTRARVKDYFQLANAKQKLPADSIATTLDATRANDHPIVQVDGPIESDTVITNPVIDPLRNAVAREKNMDEDYYHLSYESGQNDAIRDYKMKGGWGSGAFLLGFTSFASPFVSLIAANSEVKQVAAPPGMDAKLYRDGYENKMIKKRTNNAAAGAVVAKVLIFFVIVAL